MGVFLESLREHDVAQIEELAKEWTMEGIKAVVGGDEGKAVWWIVANLVAVELVTIEDVISRVVQMVSNPSDGKVSLTKLDYVDGRNYPTLSLWSCCVMSMNWFVPNLALNYVSLLWYAVF